MYRAKRAGKARCEVFDTAMHASAVKRLKLETDIRKAIDQGEFVVYYQPIVSLQSGKITGFEALSRWQTSEGLLSPDRFIKIANETGLIVPMNRRLLREACQQLREWQSQFPSTPPLTLSVNVPSRQFAQPDLAIEIGATLEQTGLDPGSLQLEIVETIAMGDAEMAGRVLSQLKALGVGLSIDDFGTGYSSLSRLQQIPVDTLKIDRTFISNMDTDADSREIVRIIIMLAHNLGLEVVAEGTERQEQVTQLKQLNCERAQGYLFCKPENGEYVTDLLTKNRSSHDWTPFELSHPM
jgi:EAL domain-containing protein (putative c-di-GMP-specific phosphodiesterase class I)